MAYLGSAVSALLVVFPLDWLNQDPDLPHVQMDLLDESGKHVRQVEDGLLLSHSDGYWHVIDTQRMDRSAV